MDAYGLYFIPHIQLESSSIYGLVSHIPNSSPNCYSSTLEKCTSYDDNSLWHYMLGHINFNTIKFILDLCNINVLNKYIPQFCGSCCLGKAHKMGVHLSPILTYGTLHPFIQLWL